MRHLHFLSQREGQEAVWQNHARGHGFEGEGYPDHHHESKWNGKRFELLTARAGEGKALAKAKKGEA